MIHQGIGNVGHLLIIISFILSFVSFFSYVLASNSKLDLSKQSFWKEIGRFAFYGHAIGVFGSIAALFLIIYRHYFEYHYAYTHSSLSLPVHYMISCFWEGQEGSFMLWIFWNCVLGIILINTQKKWEPPAMAAFSLVQAFLTSMILGTVIFGVKIGSSPFLLLRQAMEAPIFQTNPDFVPEDGTGLNPLLQNYWMVIHPPILFLGYATTLVPFAFLMAGLWKRDYTNWIKPAIPWTLLSTGMMGMGQLMGAYWAYETLSFGGYWSWDPVENAVYIPWVVQVASIHTMLMYKKNSTALKSSMILVLGTFILVLYATFLTRSGILGNASVHSFTDLGLSGQLLLYLLTFLFVSIGIMMARWKEIPSTQSEVKAYSKEFWIFMGAIVLCLMGFQVLLPTSFPVINAIIGAFGGLGSLAPPADQALYYSKWQIWGGVLVAVLSGVGQYFWWKQIGKDNWREKVTFPIIATLVLSAAIILLWKIQTISYILLLTATIFSVVTNGNILVSLLKKKPSLSGGAVSHMGIAFMLIGILFSAGYSKVISLNKSGMVYSSDLPEDMNRENVLLFVDDSREMNDYQLTYKGKRKEVKGVPGFVDASLINITSKPYIGIAEGDIMKDGKTYYKQGDSLELVLSENTYYEIEYKKNDEPAFTLFPRAQANPSMGLIVSPAIQKRIDRDLYTHISTIPDPGSELEWSKEELAEVSLGERFFINDYVAEIEKIERVDDVDGMKFFGDDVAIKAKIILHGKSQDFELNPYFLIKDNRIGMIPDEIESIGVKIALKNIYPERNKFQVGMQTAQKDYVIMKAIEMPLINVLWIGSVVLMIGIAISMAKRFKDFRMEQL